MKFALIDNNKIEATKGVKGICPVCSSEVIAKCGQVKINHWAHKRISDCDKWWENETEWHRAWKNQFPFEWQEVILPNEQTGEKHIADVRTSHGLVIEFQHSKIEASERASRETFYKNMVWVIDGSRLKRDYPQFVKGKKFLRKTDKLDFFLIDYPETCFPSAWLESSVPVIFDFRGKDSMDDLDDVRNYLYCLFPKQPNKREVTLAKISLESFVNNTIKGVWFRPHERNVKQPTTSTVFLRRREPTHYYDPRKGRFVRKFRL